MDGLQTDPCARERSQQYVKARSTSREAGARSNTVRTTVDLLSLGGFPRS